MLQLLSIFELMQKCDIKITLKKKTKIQTQPILYYLFICHFFVYLLLHYVKMKAFNILTLVLFYLLIVSIISCRKVEEVNQDPEIEPLKHGFKTTAAIGYCA